MAVSSRQLSKLQRIVPQLAGRDVSEGLLSCPHIHYASEQSFAKHLIGILHLEAPYYDHKNHYKVMGELLRVHSICGICRNVILSSVPLSKLLLRDFVEGMESKRKAVYALFHLRLFDHPKFAKMIIKSGSESLPALQSIDLYLNSLLSAVQRNKYIHDAAIMALPYAKTIFLSMKYWKEEHTLYYMVNVNERLIKIRKWIDAFEKAHPMGIAARIGAFENSKVNPMEIKAQQLYLLLMSLEPAIDLKCNGNSGAVPKNNLKAALQGVRKILSSTLKRDIRCSYSKCKIKMDSHFKLCGDCKMTYYCSRSCQKKAWSQHKANCKVLSQRYML